MTTYFWLNELNPKCTIGIWGDKIRKASEYPKYWAGAELVDNPLYAEMYLPFFDITHKAESRKWGVSYTWEISLNGKGILTRNAGHSSNVGVKTIHRYFDVNDGPLPSFEASYQYKFEASILEDGFSLEETNKLRTALGLPEVQDFVEY